MTLLRGPAIPGEPGELVDDLDRAARRRHTLIWVAGLAAALIITLPVGIGIGPVAISPSAVTRIFGHHLLGWPQTVSWSPAQDAIVWQVRAPRVMLSAVVGAGLAMTGVALQALVRNVLADPFLLGVSSGASTGAVATILFGLGAGIGASALTASAFAGALAATGLVLVIARVSGRVTSTRLLLAGVAVGYALAAVTSFLIFASGARDGAQAVLFWLLGSLALTRWSSAPAATLVVVVTLAVLVAWGRRLDALAIGDETTLALGTHPGRFRVQVFVVVSVCVGAVVAVSGTIAFVGLVVPHFARRLVGGNHRRVLPVSALTGAIFLVWADVFARVAFQPGEIPIGIVTAIVGTPFLILLVRRFYSALS